MTLSPNMNLPTLSLGVGRKGYETAKDATLPVHAVFDQLIHHGWFGKC